MRPRWLRGWSWWVEARPTGDATDRRPLFKRLAFFLGVRKEW